MSDCEQINIDVVRQMLNKGEATIVDIRDYASFQQAHIREAVWVNDQNIKDFIRETNKGKTVICYCYHGVSSRSAVSFLKTQGFKNVYSMIGGFEEWRKKY